MNFVLLICDANRENVGFLFGARDRMWRVLSILSARSWASGDPRRALRRSMSAGPGRRQPADEPRIDANMGLMCLAEWASGWVIYVYLCTL